MILDVVNNYVRQIGINDVAFGNGCAVDYEGAGLDGFHQSVVLFNGEGFQAPGLGGQANCVIVCAQADVNVADGFPFACIELGDGPLGSGAQALQSGGNNGFGFEALVYVNANYESIVFSCC